MKNLRSLFTAALISALAFTAAPARAADESPFKFEFHGFVVGSLYMQDQTFTNGQGSGLLIAAPRPSLELPQPGVATSKSGTFVGGDVRQVRPIFVVTGPEALGAKPKAHFEFDLFGNPNAGALGYESPNVRLRQAYAELKWGNTTLDAGQHSAQLLLAQIPVTVAHITNPVTYGAGLIGWRTIGFRFTHGIPMDGFKLELAAELSHGKWADATGAAFPGNVEPGNTPDAISLAWSSSLPQVVGRVKLDGKSGDITWMAWLAGSYESINLKGFGNTNVTAAACGAIPAGTPGVCLQDGTLKTSLASYAGVLGVNLVVAPVTVQGQIYTGRGTAPLAGSMVQFGDIGDFGYYAQVGVNLIKELSIWGIYGGSSVDKKDLQNWANPGGTARTVANTTLKSGNQMFGGMLRYMDSGYALGLEYYNYKTDYLLGTLAAPAGTTNTSAYQVLLSGGYFF